MKKLLVSSAIILAALCGEARQLPADEALARAMSTYTHTHKSPVKNGSRLTLSATGEYDSGIAYYIFSDSDKSLIVSADDCAEPLLAILDRPLESIDNIAPATKWWLDQYVAIISSAGDDNPAEKIAIARTAETRRDIAPILSTTWNQTSPYNDLCPDNSAGQRCYTGCVATAMSQVMKHFGHPQKGTGTASYSWYNGARNVSLSMNFANVTFDWRNMAATYTSESPATQRQAVAKLMQATGYAVEMNYSADAKGSLATSPKIASALATNFGYTKSLSLEYREHYTAEEWDALIYNNLATTGPVIYNGRGDGGGHSFVCDGYRSDGFFHINWGWGGVSDGYFRLSALNPDKLGSGGGIGGYNYDQNVVTGIRPATGADTSADPYMAIRGDLKVSASGMKITVTAQESTDMGGFYNMSYMPGEFDIAVRLSGDFMSQTIIAASNVSLLPLTGVRTLECSIPSSVMNGSYDLSLFYRLSGTYTWIPFRYNVENSYSSVRITIEGNNILVDQPVSSDPQNVSATISGDGEYENGTTPTIGARLYNANNGDRDITSFLGLCPADASGSLTMLLHSPDITTRVKARTSADVAYTLDIPEGFPAGRYRMIVGAYSGNSAYSISTSSYFVDIKENAGIEDIIPDTDNSSATRYYDLRGIEIQAADIRPGIYLVRRGNKSSLTLIK